MSSVKHQPQSFVKSTQGAHVHPSPLPLLGPIVLYGAIKIFMPSLKRAAYGCPIFQALYLHKKPDTATM
jgi:hypothetical protein